MILLLGQSGYLGEAFTKVFVENNISFYAVSRSGMDYTDYKTMLYFLNANAEAFDTLINCAGYVGKPNVDACEDHKEETIKGNVLLPSMLSDICS